MSALGNITSIKSLGSVGQTVKSEGQGSGVAQADSTTPAFATRFWSRVRKTPTCWLWTGYRHPDTGYGVLTVDGRPRTTHRLSWMLHHGAIPKDRHVLHRCIATRHCVNPDHLYLGDQDRNMKDAAEQGRLHVARPRARQLSADAMATILSAPPARGVGQRLAERFQISKAYVSLLRRGKREWKHVS